MKTRERGFSLVETMMGIGILSGIGLGGLFLSNMQKKSLISSKSDVNHAVILIREQISYVQSCELNFLNRQINSGPYQSLVNSRGETFIQEGQDVDNGNFKVTGIRLGDYHPEVMRTILEVSFKNVSGG